MPDRYQIPTPDESGNYSRSTVKDPVGNNDRYSLLKCVTPNTNKKSPRGATGVQQAALQG